jgi:transcriptional regulator with GAF, ATPase, and Fis domain
VRGRLDLIDQFTELVIGAGDPRHLAERTLDVVIALNNGRSGAVFAFEGERLSLFASRGIDQTVLDAIQLIWNRSHESLRRGETFYVPERSAERLPLSDADRSLVSSIVVVPVLAGGTLAALLYVDSVDPHFCDVNDLDRLAKFSRILAKAVADSAAKPDGVKATPDFGWETYLERTPVEDMEREKLLLLLNRNEWNIARVARLMGVTRRTIYLRLQRYKIPRERVSKSRVRHATA